MVPKPRKPIAVPRPVTFSLSSPPPATPTRSASGAPIKIKVIRAMQSQVEAEQEASSALDKMIRTLRKATKLSAPPAVGGGAGSLVLEK